MNTNDPKVLLVELTDALLAWLPSQRWFSGKNQELRSLEVRSAVTLLTGDPWLVHGIIRSTAADGRRADYQVIVGARSEVPERLTHAIIGAAAGLTCYDAVHDAELTSRLLELTADNAVIESISFTTEPETQLNANLRARPVTSEQSNTSLVFGQRYILKLFRKLAPGPNPDLRLHRALYSLGSAHIARPLAAMHASMGSDQDQKTFVLGVMQEFLPGAAEGWSMATASVRDLFAEADLYADEVGGDFAAEARRLGQALGEVHADLRQALGEGPSEPWSEVADAMHHRLDSALSLVPELAPFEAALRSAFDKIHRDDHFVHTQYIHGDLHLGQVLRTPNDWVLIDFEGEPDVPLIERNLPRSPLRDVAGMLRSFDYAANQMLVNQPHDNQLRVRALEWVQRNQVAFREGYADTVSDHSTADFAQEPLLRAFELDKAVYEVCYEHGNRPDWLLIPLGAIARITGEGN